MKRQTALIAAFLALLLMTVACTRANAPEPATPSAPATPAEPTPDGTILRKSEGKILHRTYEPDQQVPSSEGYFTLDPATGRVDAWTLAEPDTTDRLMRVFFAPTQDGHWIVARTAETGYLIARTGGSVYTYDRRRYELLDASAKALVFEEMQALTPGQTIYYNLSGPGSDAGGTGKLHLLGGDLLPQATIALPIATSSTHPRIALLSPDGSKLALSEGRLYLVNLKTGEHTTYESDSGIGQITPDQDGKSFRLIPAYATDAPPFRYTWDGQTLPYVSGDLAPTGSLTLTRDWLEGFTPALVVRDAASGQPRFRILGAEQCYGYAIAGSHWTADGSAILFGARSGFFIAGLDGNLRQPAAFNTKGEWHEPFPSPTDPNRFADRVTVQENQAWRLDITQESGKRIQSAAFDDKRSGLWPVGPLWHPTGTFVQISWYNRGGTGAPCGDYRIPLAPVVQKAPFPDQLTLMVAGTGDCLNLRTEPALTAQIVTCLKDGSRVTVAPNEQQIAQIWGDGQQWARVRTADGKVGWASVEEQYLSFSN